MRASSKNHFTLTSLLATLLLAACTGGSSGGNTASPSGNTPTPAPGPDPISAYDTAEYRENAAYAQMNIQAAYLNGYTGEGVLVAVIDSGVSNVPELQGQLHPDSTNVATGLDADKDDLNGHGTSIAGIIAANKDNLNTAFNMHGIAYNAQILNINATTAANCPDAENCSFYHSDIASGYDYARLHGADVINESLGSDTPSSAALVTAMQLAVTADIVIVVPAGNLPDSPTPGQGDNAQASAAVAYAAWANGQIIIAGSVDENNIISDFSYKAGEDAKNVFLVAPGDGVIAPDHLTTNDYDYVSTTGTSASTALISATAALLIEAFPNLSAAETVDLLFTTATDLGDPGVDIIYGHGLVNLEEAFSAQGQLSIAGLGFAAGVDIGNDENVASQNLIFSGGAFGADISFSNSLNNIMVLDDYDRSFNVNLSQGILINEPHLSIDRFMDGGLYNRRQSMQLGANLNVKMGWRYDDRFYELDQSQFSNHLGKARDAGNLRMSLSYKLDNDATASASAGMSLTEMMEDYRPDDYMAPNKHGFSSLLSPPDTQAISYKAARGKKFSHDIAFARSDFTFGQELFSERINVKSSLLLNRINYRPSDQLNFSFDAGMLMEKGSVLGAISRGAIEIGKGASTGFIGAKMDFQISEKSGFFARASYGFTSVIGSSSSIIGDISTLKSYSYLAGIKSSGIIRSNDQLSFSVSQPLKLVGGHGFISNAVSRNYADDSFAMNYNQVNLSPSGTERDFELSYSIADISGMRIRLNMLHQLNPGHIKSIKSASSILLRIGSSF